MASGEERRAGSQSGTAGTANFEQEQLGSKKKPFDCAVIGGGPAGLSAAIYLGRMRRSSMVFDDHAGRSLWSQVNRNYLGFPEGVEAAELRRLGRLQADKYGAKFCNGCVLGLEQQDGLFVVRTGPASEPDAGAGDNIERDEDQAEELGEAQVSGESKLFASTVIFATGVTDHFPDFAGRDECVGVTLFWCTICDGYETLGKRIIVLGTDEEAVSTALQLRQFTNTISLVAGSDEFEVQGSRLHDLRVAGIEAFAAPVAEYENSSGCLSALKLADAHQTTLPLDLLFTSQPKTPNSDLARQLGVELDESGYIKADHEQKTNVPGVYAAGDVTRMHNHQISSAVHEGGAAASAANYYLYGQIQKSEEE